MPLGAEGADQDHSQSSYGLAVLDPSSDHPKRLAAVPQAIQGEEPPSEQSAPPAAGEPTGEPAPYFAPRAQSQTLRKVPAKCLGH